MKILLRLKIVPRVLQKVRKSNVFEISKIFSWKKYFCYKLKINPIFIRVVTQMKFLIIAPTDTFLSKSGKNRTFLKFFSRKNSWNFWNFFLEVIWDFRKNLKICPIFISKTHLKILLVNILKFLKIARRVTFSWESAESRTFSNFFLEVIFFLTTENFHEWNWQNLKRLEFSSMEIM